MYDIDFDEEEYWWRREKYEYDQKRLAEKEERRQEAQIKYEALVRAGLIEGE